MTDEKSPFKDTQDPPLIDGISPTGLPQSLGEELMGKLSDSMRYHATDYDADYLRETYQEIVDGGADHETLSIVEKILSEGRYQDKDIILDDVHRNAISIVRERRWLAMLYSKHPEVAAVIMEEEIAGFHVTRSQALGGLIEDGALLSGAESEKRGKGVLTGGQDASRAGTGQTSISFGNLAALGTNINFWGSPVEIIHKTDEQVIAEISKGIEKEDSLAAQEEPGSYWQSFYLSSARRARGSLEAFRSNPKSLTSTLMRISFPVAVGISADAVLHEAGKTENNLPLRHGQSHMGEFRLGVSQIPLQELPVIAVPGIEGGRIIRGVQAVLEKFGHSGVKVLALENLLEPMPGITEPKMVQ